MNTGKLLNACPKAAFAVTVRQASLYRNSCFQQVLNETGEDGTEADQGKPRQQAWLSSPQWKLFLTFLTLTHPSVDTNALSMEPELK